MVDLATERDLRAVPKNGRPLPAAQRVDHLVRHAQPRGRATGLDAALWEAFFVAGRVEGADAPSA